MIKSYKMEFSLKHIGLITIFALAFVVFSVLAADFDVTITGPQLEFYEPTATSLTVQLIVTSEQPLPIDFPDPEDNVTLYVEDEKGFVILAADDSGTTKILGYDIDIEDDPNYPLRTPKVRRLNLKIKINTDEHPVRRVRKIVLIIPDFRTPDPTVDAADDTSNEVLHVLSIMEGVIPPDADHPRVVSIQRLRSISQTAVSAFEEQKIEPAPFEVRIVFTERPADFHNFLTKIRVDHGEASNLIIGSPFTWHGAMTTDDPPAPDPGKTIRPNPIEGRYNHDGVITPLFRRLSRQCCISPLGRRRGGIGRSESPVAEWS